ncbi:nucleotidyltransferase domain-containing protein [Blastococcus colisei]|uniref:nucleotidyltransferase domain-containing protein n=1 Tax=Blastococcus colisei TaxID=1564162 RepID=UPI0014771236|nr:nucleotidyltransferase family protein [Blastococcus colisei]
MSQVDQDRLLELANRHRVAAAVGASLRGCGDLRAEVRAKLNLASRAVAVRQLLLESELGRIDSTLRQVPWLVVKGPALARGYYRRPELRSYVDLDVLVRPTLLHEALRLLEEKGYVLLDRNWTLLVQRLSGELHLRSPRGAMIDLHWDLFNDRATRDSYAMVTDTFFQRATSLTLAGGLQVQTLDVLDTIVHTAVHAARSGGDRLVWLKDLEQLVLAGGFSWDELAERSAQHHAELAVSVMLHRMRATFGSPEIPDEVLRQIGGRGSWRVLGRVVDRVAPVTRAGPDGSLTRMFARATRADGRSAAVELGHRLIARARRGGWAEPDHTWDAAHPHSVLYESGGASAKAAFFDAVGARRPGVHHSQ